jgi:hypothetical protein
MCYSKDYKIFDDRKKAEDARQERRAGVIDGLLDEANKHGKKIKVEGPPVKDIRTGQIARLQESRCGAASP